jgi:hypothetical protein
VRARIGDLLGQLRDTHREHDSDTTERLATDNTALKQRVRDLTAQQRTWERAEPFPTAVRPLTGSRVTQPQYQSANQ